MFKECIDAGRANEGLRADWLQQFAIVKKEHLCIQCLHNAFDAGYDAYKEKVRRWI